MIGLVIAALSFVIWIYLLAFRGGFWRAKERDNAVASIGQRNIVWPRVIAIIPMRDEAALIGETLATLLAQDYRGDLHLIVVDDHSGDHSIDAARRAASAAGAADRVSVLAAPALPEGWTGKLWALHYGIREARTLGREPDYLLLGDADIRFAYDTLTKLMQRTLRDRLVLTSLMAKLRCVSRAERFLVPAFLFFFQMLYPFAWVRRPDRSTAAAAGGCMLVHSETLESAGGIAAIRGELIDDCALARLLKARGAIWLGLSEGVQSARAYPGIGDIRSMVRRCAYAQLRYSPWWLAVTVAGMTLSFLAAPILLIIGGDSTRMLAAASWALMALAMKPMLRFYGLSPWRGLALPVVASAYIAFTLESAWQHWHGRGGQWKGRVYREVPTHEIASHGH